MSDHYFDLTEEVKRRLHVAGTQPNKIRGQHFLVDKESLAAVVDAAHIKKGEVVLEIGPGIGNLTDELLAGGAQIVAVEKDERLAAFLTSYFGERVEIHSQDILSFDETTLSTPYTVVGNIPYYITGKIIRKFLESAHQPRHMVLTVQREVAERVAATAPHATFLSVLTHLMSKVTLGPVIEKKHFWPEPKVDSQVIIITPHTPRSDVDTKLIRLIKMGFAHPRKTLRNNLKSLPGVDNVVLKRAFERMDFSENTRAHELSLEEWRVFFEALSSKIHE